MSEFYDTWDKEDFKAFIMIHLANADLSVSQDEMYMIMENVSSDRYKKIKLAWDKSNDYTCLKIIKSLKDKFYPGEEGKEELIESMLRFARVDKIISMNEKILISAMNKLL